MHIIITFTRCHRFNNQRQVCTKTVITIIIFILTSYANSSIARLSEKSKGSKKKKVILPTDATQLTLNIKPEDIASLDKHPCHHRALVYMYSYVHTYKHRKKVDRLIMGET